jgi:hypothetical protein
MKLFSSLEDVLCDVCGGRKNNVLVEICGVYLHGKLL